MKEIKRTSRIRREGIGEFHLSQTWAQLSFVEI
jgi:hypothetical protein